MEAILGAYPQFSLIALTARGCLWLAVASLVMLPLEWVHPRVRGARGSREIVANIGWFACNTLIAVPLIAFLSALVARGVLALGADAPARAVAQWPLPLRAGAALLLGECGFYWGHRFSHEWPWLWRFHRIHHAGSFLHYLVNTQMHPVDMVFTRMCGTVPLVAAGLVFTPGHDGALAVPLALFAGSLWSYLLHANVGFRWRWMDRIVATPFFHHWHHARTSGRGCNYAATLPLFDVMFGTHARATDWPAAYGIDETIPRDMVGGLIAPFMPGPVSPETRVAAAPPR